MGMAVPAALAISAADPAGGLLATDLLGFRAHGVLGSGVVTAVTARGLRQPGPVQDVPVTLLRASLEAILAGEAPAAMKVGVLTSVPAVRTVARAVAARPEPRVLDPGFAPRSGVRLVRPAVVDAVLRDLLPGATLLVVNLGEASALAGFALRNEADAKAAARRIQALGPAAVLVTGGATEGPTLVDGLLDGRTWYRFECRRIAVPAGTRARDLLSASVTALLAAGETLPDAVARALPYVRSSLEAGWPAFPLPDPPARRPPDAPR